MKALILVVFVAASSTGCATCANHPTACAIGGALVVGSVAATVALHNADRRETNPEFNAAERPYLK